MTINYGKTTTDQKFNSNLREFLRNRVFLRAIIPPGRAREEGGVRGFDGDGTSSLPPPPLPPGLRPVQWAAKEMLGPI